MMKKAICDDRICLVFDSLEEAKNILTALSAIVPFYTKDADGEIVEIRNLKDVSITLIASAKIRRLGGEKDESVCGGEWLKNSIS